MSKKSDLKLSIKIQFIDILVIMTTVPLKRIQSVTANYIQYLVSESQVVCTAGILKLIMIQQYHFFMTIFPLFPSMSVNTTF